MRRTLPGVIAILVGVQLLAALPALADDSARSIRVMTYNIGAFAPIPLGPRQFAQIAQEIKDAEADLVGLQEVGVGTETRPRIDMVLEIDAALNAIDYPMEPYFEAYIPSGRGYGALLILSRYPIVSVGFADTLPVEDSFKVLRATVECAPRAYLHFFLTHYYIGDGRYHQYQTDAVLDYVTAFRGPRILVGDFNFNEVSPYYGQFMAAGLDDACVASGAPDCLTVGYQAGRAAPLPRVGQIDFVFGSADVTFEDAYVPDTSVSDHWPLVASARTPSCPAARQE
jgi:endonuclease/exonuclease/phosphatase family metal-dependent hydrolase